MCSLLQTDYIDVCLIHYCDSEKDWQAIPDNGILDYAGEFKKAGKIGHIGLSSHNPVVARKAVETGRIELLMFSVYPCYDLQPVRFMDYQRHGVCAAALLGAHGHTGPAPDAGICSYPSSLTLPLTDTATLALCE
jgi:predicted aldo/keto reductase-like oxidoreductase